MKLRKLLSSILVICMMAAVGCSSALAASPDGELRSSDYAEHITIDVFNLNAADSGEQRGWFAKYVEDRWNMTLNIIANEGNASAKFQTLAASGNLGDLVIFSGPGQEFQQAMKAGLLMDLSGVLDENMPYFVEHFPVAVERMENFSGDGAMYGIPTRVSMESPLLSQNASEVDYGVMIRYDYYLGAGAPELTTIEDLIDCLEIMKEKYPTTEDGKVTYGASLHSGMDNAAGMQHAQTFFGVYGYQALTGDSIVYVDNMAQEYQHVLQEDSLYLRGLRFFYELNQRGLLDPDSITQSQTDASEKFRSGSVFYSNWYWEAKNQFNTQENVAAGIGYEMAPLQDQKISSTGFSPGGTNGPVLALGKDCKDVSRILDFLDWAYTPEGIMTLYNGPEGLTFEYDADGQPYLTEYGKSALPQNKVDVPAEWGGSNFADGFQKLNLYPVSNAETAPFGEAYKYANWSSTLSEAMSNLDIIWSENMGGARYTKEYLVLNDMLSVIPGNTYTAPAMDTDMRTIRDQVGNILKQYSWQMIYAKDDAEYEALKETMVEMAKDLGYDELLEYYLSMRPGLEAARLESVNSVQ